MSIAIISHPDCALHDAGINHPEQPARVTTIDNALHDFSWEVPVHFYEAPLATLMQLKAVHEPRYIDWLISIAPKKTKIHIDEDTIMNPHTIRAAQLAAGAVIKAVDLVLKGDETVAFCNVRPPGHHAEYEKAMGFCFFNNVCVGVKYCLQHYDLSRVAIIDFDVHHGNGTQNIVQGNKKVLYCSSFQHPFYPGYEEEMDTTHILNVPLSAGTKGDEFREKVREKWFEKILTFKPQLFFISAGFDAHQDDPLANINLTIEDYVWLSQEIAKLAKETAQGRIISVLEGGYNLEVLATCVPAHVNALLKT